MISAKFILSKNVVKKQVNKLKDLGLKLSYSYKTNREVGDVLQQILPATHFSIHAKEEVEMIHDKSKIWFFIQAESKEELIIILEKGVKNFVIDNEKDLEILLQVLKQVKIKVNLSLRMKFKEHRIGTGKYFVYGMSSKKINILVESIKDNLFIDKLGIHVHRKTQNTSEWEIKGELEDSLEKETLERINFLNLGGGLPSVYRGYSSNIFDYIYSKLIEVRNFLENKNIEVYIESGRFIAAPSVILVTEVVQIQDKNTLLINTTIYNCALDTLITGTKMLVQGELEEGGEDYLIKGNSPTRDDIFRYRVKLRSKKVGDGIVFLNAGAYNYTTDFFGDRKLETEIVENFSE